MNRMLDEITPEELAAVTVEVTNPESPFGGVQVFGVSDAPIQIVLREGAQGEPGPPGPPGPSGEAPSGAVINNQGITRLVEGQSFIDVVFPIPQINTHWTLVECYVVNTVDSSPLNIWQGIMTVRGTTGFRMQLNGMPDSANYYLRWSTVGGADLGDVVATTYILSGPVSGPVGEATTFSVSLPPGTTVGSSVTVTPHDAGGGGVFMPTIVELTDDVPSANFTYTPATYGSKTISTTNDAALADPPSITFTPTSGTYTLTGPGSGSIGVPSTNFTVALPVGGVVAGTLIVTPDDGGAGGTFTPSIVSLTTAAPSATFTYTAATGGTKTISVTNDGGLTNPANLTYTAALAQHLLNTLISYWKLDEASTGASPVTRVDSQGSNNLTDINNVPSVVALINNGANFTTATQHLEHASNASLQVTGDFTFSFWVYLVTVGSYAFISKADFTSGGIDYEFGCDTTGLYFMAHYSGAGTDIIYAAGAPTAATVYHIVGWWDSATSRANIRVNDAATFTATTGAALTQTATPFWMGGRPTATLPAYANAVIDEVGFWKRKLTAAEITFLYNGGAANPYSSFLA